MVCDREWSQAVALEGLLTDFCFVANRDSNGRGQGRAEGRSVVVPCAMFFHAFWFAV